MPGCPPKRNQLTLLTHCKPCRKHATPHAKGHYTGRAKNTGAAPARLICRHCLFACSAPVRPWTSPSPVVTFIIHPANIIAIDLLFTPLHRPPQQNIAPSKRPCSPKNVADHPYHPTSQPSTHTFQPTNATPTQRRPPIAAKRKGQTETAVSSLAYPLVHHCAHCVANKSIRRSPGTHEPASSQIRIATLIPSCPSPCICRCFRRHGSRQGH